MASEAQEKMVEFTGGMKRNSTKPRFDLIETQWLRGVAQVLTEGAIKYGERNWQKADEVAAKDAINHLIDHAMAFKDGDTSEEHLYNICCNAMFLDFYRRKFPELFAPKTNQTTGEKI